MRTGLIHKGFAALALLSLAACSAPEGTSPTERQNTSAVAPPSSEAGGRIVLSGEGGRTTGPDGQQLFFGQNAVEALAVLSASFGQLGELETNGDCGAGPMEFLSVPDGLTMNFQRGNLVGWYLDGPGPGEGAATPEGITPGSTLADARQVYAVSSIAGSTLGDEFSADEGIGIFAEGQGDDARITSLYAGVNCFFR